MKDWSISSRTFAMPTGGGAVHAYIAISDPMGRVVAEYHGFPFTRRPLEKVSKPRVFDWDDPRRQADNFWSITPVHNFRLEAERVPGEFWNARQDLRVHDEEVFIGTGDQVAAIRSALDDGMKAINQRDFDYGAAHWLSESQNSNSVYATLMGIADDKAQEMGADRIAIPGRLLQDDIVFDRQSRSSWAPGIHRDLLQGGTASSAKKAAPLVGNKS